MLTWTEFAIYMALLGTLSIGGLGLLSWRLDWWTPGQTFAVARPRATRR